MLEACQLIRYYCATMSGCYLFRYLLTSEETKLDIRTAGGYGWIIVIASFFANVVVDGIIYSIGETLVGIWERDFRTTTMQASIAQSLLAGFYFLAGVLLFCSPFFHRRQ